MDGTDERLAEDPRSNWFEYKACAGRWDVRVRRSRDNLELEI